MGQHRQYKNAAAFLASIEDLPSLSTVVSRVVELVDSADTSAGDIAKVMVEDPAMTAKVLRIVNSAIYAAAGGRITSVPFAISRMGFLEVKNIVLTMGVLKSFKNDKQSLDYRQFWTHSITVANAANIIAKMSPRVSLLSSPQDNPYFVAGLLHDIGLLVFDQVDSAGVNKLLVDAETNQKPFHELEQEHFGFDHQELGGLLLEKWHLPEKICQAVRYHHNPSLAPDQDELFVQVLHVADWICNHQAYGLTVDGMAIRFSDTAWNQLGLDVDLTPEIIQKTKVAAARSAMLTSLLDD